MDGFPIHPREHETVSNVPGESPATKTPAEARPSPLFGPAARVWVLSAAIIGITAYLWSGHIRHLESVRSPFQIYWPVLAALFYLTEIYVVHFEVKRDAHSFSLSEIP